MEKMLDAQQQLVRKKTKTSYFAPLLVLIVLAPTIAEVLLGNVLFNGTFVWQLVIDTLLYGSGAILVREVARRRHLGWGSSCWRWPMQLWKRDSSCSRCSIHTSLDWSR